MYWLFSDEESSRVRNDMNNLFNTLLSITSNPQHYKESIFTFSGRKCFKVGQGIIDSLSKENEVVFDPFLGSGSFLISSQYSKRKFVGTELDPYMNFMHRNIFTQEFNFKELDRVLNAIEADIKSVMEDLYSTSCDCGTKNTIKAVYFDFKSKVYINPTRHERNKDNKNLVFINKCSNKDCKKSRKKLDINDLSKINLIPSKYKSLINKFPKHKLIINSRINITLNKSDKYDYFFTDRQKVALITIYNSIKKLSNGRHINFFMMVFLANLNLSKTSDYRTQSQDLYYIPPLKNKEQNIWYQFNQKYRDFKKGYMEILYRNKGVFNIENNKSYKLFNVFNNINDVLESKEKGVFYLEGDYRNILSIPDNVLDLVLTDPPYKDQVPYLERSQLYYPWINNPLTKELLEKEIVISDSPERKNKKVHNYWKDIDEFFGIMYKKMKTHKYMALYFQPSGGAKWLEDLNNLKLIARKNGLEPLQTFDLVQKDDPSKRKIASATWSFSKEILLVFIKLDEQERYWFIDDNNIDKLIFKSMNSVIDLGDGSFELKAFQEAFYKELKEVGITYKVQYNSRLLSHLKRYSIIRGDKGIIKEDILPPFRDLIRQVDVELRIFDYTPVVVEELLDENPSGFSYPDFLLRLSLYLDNGEKEVIKILEAAGSDNKIKSELGAYVIESGSKLIRKPPVNFSSFSEDCTRKDLNNLSGVEFEELMQEYLMKIGFSNVRTTKATDDRGVDLLAEKDSERYVIQCKRWKNTSPVSATPIQRVDSFKNSRKLQKAWVITTSYFTPSAIAEARLTGVELIDGKAIRNLLEKKYPGAFK